MGKVIWIPLVIMVGLIVVVVSCAMYLSAPGYKGPKSPHFDGKRFHNLEQHEDKTLWDVIRWRWSRKDPKWPVWVENEKYPLPTSRFTDTRAFSVTFINHATALIQEKGINILTDPIWSDRASPFSWAGPKRVRAPGVKLDQLPKIDVILLSHNHYDHLDIKTLKKINKRDQPSVSYTHLTLPTIYSV